MGPNGERTFVDHCLQTSIADQRNELDFAFVRETVRRWARWFERIQVTRDHVQEGNAFLTHRGVCTSPDRAPAGVETG